MVEKKKKATEAAPETGNKDSAKNKLTLQLKHFFDPEEN